MAAAPPPLPPIGSRYQFGPARIATVVAHKQLKKKQLVQLKFDDNVEYAGAGQWFDVHFLGPEVNASGPPGATEGGRRRMRKKTRRNLKRKSRRA